jgi:hypothetical protein
MHELGPPCSSHPAGRQHNTTHLILYAAVVLVHLLQEVVPLLQVLQMVHQGALAGCFQAGHFGCEGIKLRADGVVQVAVQKVDGGELAGLCWGARSAQPERSTARPVASTQCSCHWCEASRQTCYGCVNSDAVW